MGDIVKPGRRKQQLAAYSQPLTAAQKKNWGRQIKPLGFEGPAGKLGNAFVGGAGSDPWKAYLKGNYAHGEERQGARQNLRQLAREWGQSDYNSRWTDMPKNYINKQFGKFIGEQQQLQQPTPDMGYNPLGDYGEPAADETEMQRTAHYRPAKVQALLDRKKKLLENHSRAWLDTWLAEAEPDLTGARGGPGEIGYGKRLNDLLGSGDAEGLQALATKMGSKAFQQLLRMYSKPRMGNNVYQPDQIAILENMGYVVPENAIAKDWSAPGVTLEALMNDEIGKRGNGFGGQGEPTAPPAGEGTGLTAQSATDKIKEQAALMGLPLTPEFEAQMRVYEDQLAAQLAEIGVAREQIQPMLDLALERMATQQGIDTGSLRESLVDRGIYDSGTTTRDWSRLNADYARSQQDLAMNAANQYSQLASAEGGAYLGYQQQMIEALIERAISAAQNVPLGLRTDGYDGVGADAATKRRARIRERRQDRRADRRAENA